MVCRVMETQSAILFDTALGRCGIAWHGSGILAVSFPEESDMETMSALQRRAPDAQIADSVPDDIASVIGLITDLFSGKKPDLAGARLDMNGISPFEQGLYGLTRNIKPGEVRTYGELARQLGDVSLSRQVGQSLGRNPFPIIVPCHRVVGSGGTMTGFSAPGGTNTKRSLLKIEGAIGPDLFDLLN